MLLTALASVASPALAGETTPAKLEAAILTRALAYNRALRDCVGDTVIIGVISRRDDHTSRRRAEEMLSAFRALSGRTIQGLPLRVIDLPLDADSNLQDTLMHHKINVAYLAPGLGAQLKAVAAETRAMGCGTLTGVESYVRDNAAAIGVVMSGGRPTLLINLPVAKAERMELDSAVLQLSEVLR